MSACISISQIKLTHTCRSSVFLYFYRYCRVHSARLYPKCLYYRFTPLITCVCVCVFALTTSSQWDSSFELKSHRSCVCVCDMILVHRCTRNHIVIINLSSFSTNTGHIEQTYFAQLDSKCYTSYSTWNHHGVFVHSRTKQCNENSFECCFGSFHLSSLSG